MRTRSQRGTIPTASRIVITAASLWALSAAPAAANSSLDAYGGQAAVLGKPAQVHKTASSAGAALTQAGNQGAVNPAGPAAGGTPGPGGPSAGSGAPGSSGHPSSSGHPGSSPILSVVSNASPDRIVSGLRGSGASLPFSLIDALLLAAGALGLAFVGLLIRRLARTWV